MRLTQHETNTICDVVHQMDADAQVWLFGSRVDDSKRGGDIDLFIRSSRMTRTDVRKVHVLLEERLGEQKLDIVCEPDLIKPFVQEIMMEAIPLESGMNR